MVKAFKKKNLHEIREMAGIKRIGNNSGKYLDILKRTGKSKR
jgi:hypothetical protein